jgi:hypothetical protein
MTGRTSICVDEVCLAVLKRPTAIAAVKTRVYVEDGGIGPFETFHYIERDPPARLKRH